MKRCAGLSTAPPVPVAVCPSAPTPARRKGKGSKHANRCAGPWVSALDKMPPPPLSCAKRARAGLADVPAPHGESKRLKAERAARALVALLPHGSAAWILRDPEERILTRTPQETAERLVELLTPYGAGSLGSAYSAYGRLLAWVAANRPDSAVVTGSDFSD